MHSITSCQTSPTPRDHVRDRAESDLTRAYILVTVAVGAARDVQRQIRDRCDEHAAAAGDFRIVAVDVLAGRYDVAVVVEAASPLEIGEVVTEWLQQGVRGITGTITLLRIG